MKIAEINNPPKRKMRPQVSLVDVAARANVSVGTVSHVLNRNAGARIAAGTQERVWKIAEEMGYRPNLFARSLHGKASNTLGLMVAGLQNPFFVAVAREFEQLAIEFGYQVVLDTTISEAWAYRKHAANYAWPVDGIFVFSALEQDLNYYLGAQAAQLPVVYLGYQEGKPLDNVGFDLLGGGKLMAEYLLSRGYRKIAILNTSSFAEKIEVVDLRIASFEEVLRSHGLLAEHIVIPPLTSIQDAFAAGLKIASRPVDELPEVVFCTGDVAAIGVFNAFRNASLRVPEQIGVAGFDGIVEGQCLERRLTTINCPVHEFVQAALDLLIGRVSGKHEFEPRNIPIPTTLSVGETTR